MDRVSPAIIGHVLLVAFLVIPGARVALAQEAEGEIEITVEVVPSGGTGTVSAVLTETAPMDTGTAEDASSIDLVVADDRGTADGWQVQIMQVPVATPVEPLVLPRQLRRTEVVVGQPPQAMLGPRWNRLASGQSLGEPIPVLSAAPGAGAGVYRHPLDVVSPGDTTDGSPYQLVVTISSAP